MEHYTQKELLLTLTASGLLTIVAYFSVHDNVNVEHITFSEPVIIMPALAR